MHTHTYAHIVTVCTVGCEVSVSILQGKLRVERGVGLASAAGTATVKRILDHSGESVTSLSAGQKGTITLIDRYLDLNT